MQKEMGGKITLGLVNSGTIDVKYLELYVLPSEDFELISTTDYFYIGDLDSDDTDSEEIEIYVKDKDNLNIPVKIKYFDSNNKQFQQQFNLEMNLYSKSQLKKFGKIESSNSSIYFVLLILSIVGYIFYRKKKKNGLIKK